MSNITSVASPAEIFAANKIPIEKGNVSEPAGADFGSMLTDAIKQADDLQTVSQQGSEALLAGETDDIAKVMIDGTKAELSLNMVIQVRNKVLDAYNEIMRMNL